MKVTWLRNLARRGGIAGLLLAGIYVGFRRSRGPILPALAAILVIAGFLGLNGHNSGTGRPELRRAESAPRFEIKELRTQGLASVAVTLNERGDAAGLIVKDRESLHAAMWHGGRAKDLGTLGGRVSIATDINNRGELAGHSETRDGRFLAFQWRGQKMEPLRGLKSIVSGASAINDRREIVGFSHTGDTRACIWAAGRGRLLPLPDGKQDTIAEDLDGNVNAIGYWFDTKIDLAGAIHWRGDRPIELGTIGGDSGAAFAMSDGGHVVGASSLPGGKDAEWHATLWEGEKARDLGKLKGSEWSGAFGVNKMGDVVGASGVGCSEARACLWSGGNVYDLNSLIPQRAGWQLLNAAAINNRGQIAGTGIKGNRLLGFVLTPKPASENMSHTEPADSGFGPGGRCRPDTCLITNYVFGLRFPFMARFADHRDRRARSFPK